MLAVSYRTFLLLKHAHSLCLPWQEHVVANRQWTAPLYLPSIVTSFGIVFVGALRPFNRCESYNTASLRRKRPRLGNPIATTMPAQGTTTTSTLRRASIPSSHLHYYYCINFQYDTTVGLIGLAITGTVEGMPRFFRVDIFQKAWSFSTYWTKFRSTAIETVSIDISVAMHG